MHNIKETQDAIDYLDKNWPKGKKDEVGGRGKAMVLLALANIGGREEQKLIFSNTELKNITSRTNKKELIEMIKILKEKNKMADKLINRSMKLNQTYRKIFIDYYNSMDKILQKEKRTLVFFIIIYLIVILFSLIRIWI